MKPLIFLLAFLAAALPCLRAEETGLRLNTLRIVAKDGLKELIKEEVLQRLSRMESACELSSVEPSDPAKRSTVVLTLAPARDLTGKAARPLLWKGILIAVSRKNPYGNLSKQQAEQILGNRFPVWPETDIPVRNIYYLPHIFEPGKEPRNNGKTRFSPVRFADIAEKLLEHDPKAIVLLPLAGVIAPPGTLKLVSIDGVVPDFESITKGRYPLQEQYSLAVGNHAPREVAALADRLLSPDYQRTILNFGSIPILSTNGDAQK